MKDNGNPLRSFIERRGHTYWLSYTVRGVFGVLWVVLVLRLRGARVRVVRRPDIYAIYSRYSPVPAFRLRR